MRPERTPRTLRQIADACSFVLSVTEGKTLEDYSGERLLRQGVERNLQIIGEAVGRLRRDDPKTADRLSNYLKKDRRCWRRYHSKMQATLISPR